MSRECNYYLVEEAELYQYNGPEDVRWQRSIPGIAFRLLEDAVKFMRNREENPIYRYFAFRIMHHIEKVVVTGRPAVTQFDHSGPSK